MTAELEHDAFQTKTRLVALLEAAGLRPRRRFGQNFLIDRNLMRVLVDSAEIAPDDCVLEVGAGTGCLTCQLAGVARRVVAAEIDPRLVPIALEALRGRENVTLVAGDALESKSRVSPALLSAVTRARADAPGALKLVANLPYDIATPLVMELLLADIGLTRLCFTVQTEVAERFLASPATGDYGPVSVVAQTLTVGRRVARAPARAFWPAPKVQSTMVRLDVRPKRDIPAGLVARAFAGFVRSFFLHRRKTLAALARRMDDAERLTSAMERLGIDPKSRPEELAPSTWVAFYLAAL